LKLSGFANALLSVFSPRFASCRGAATHKSICKTKRFEKEQPSSLLGRDLFAGDAKDFFF